MNVGTYIVIGIQVISALAVIILVMLQKLKEGDGLTGSTNEGASGMGLSKDKIYSRWTIIFGVIFVIATIASSTLMYNSLK
ncbi:MAG: preprotein translocase subunit SecG [Clostridia bacterium]|nr:preprotein translocase subunit SecG [Clostridia bacterium]